MSNNAHELSNRLLNALDNNYNVVDMHTVNEIISILEKFNITKELLETTRLGKHVNELRRKTSDPSLARRAKVLVKRWRDLVIPTVASPGHTGSNRSSAERTVRRLGGTPLTSPALSRVVSPAVHSPRTVSRPAWGGYESDSNDVILVDDDPPPAPPPAPLPALHKPITPPVKRPPSPEPLYDEKKAKRDKKPKKKRGHSRAGSGTEATPAPAPAPGGWRDRNGTAERRRNGCRKDALDPYTALVNKMPPAGGKKVKTTKELLEQIQSRGSRGGASPDESPAGSPASPDVMLIEPPSPAKAESPLRNGGASPPAETVAEPGEAWWEREEVCACGEQAEPACPLGAARRVRPRHVRALHAALLPGLNGTLAPPLPHRFAARATPHPERPDLFASVVPLYKYSDYTDDRLVKNMSGVPLCVHLPQDEFAPPPPSPPPAPPPPSPRPYPLDDDATDAESDAEPDRLQPPVKAEPMEQETPAEPAPAPPEPSRPAPADSQPPAHRTVERTKAPPSPSPSPPPPSPLDGAALVAACRRAVAAAPFDYSQLAEAPLAPADDALDAALAAAAASTRRDSLARPLAPDHFAEWHECARLGDLIALPYVVID